MTPAPRTRSVGGPRRPPEPRQAPPRDAAVETAEGRPGDREALERHRPRIRHDAQEPYRVCSAATITLAPANILVRQDGAVVARAADRDETRLSLALLSDYPGDLRAHGGDRLDEGPDELADAQRLQRRPEHADRVYGRVVRQGTTTWLQYWMWLYYNPKHLLGFGRHEGDWEMVQVALDEAGRPRQATYAQHAGGEARPWTGVERDTADGGEHPVVYLAPFSHASYFEPGPHAYLGGLDVPDGQGLSVLPQVEPFGPWATWPGRWGNSTGVLGRALGGRLGGRSPASPGRQGAKWSDPDAFHAASSRGGGARRAARTGLRAADRVAAPGTPALRARLEGRRALVDFEVGRGVLLRPTQLLVTVHEDDARQEVLLSQTVPLEQSAGTAEIPLPRDADRVVVRASAFNALRQRSATASTTAAAGG